MSRLFLNERDQEELDEFRLLDNHWLQGLVETFGWRAVDSICRQELGYPASFVDSREEAIEIASHL